MNKYLKNIVLFFMALASMISFSKIYGDYQNYQLVTNDKYYDYGFYFNLDIMEVMDENKALDDLFRIIKENDLIITNRIREGIYYYYNPNKIESYESIIKNYQQNCKYRCYEIKEMKRSDFVIVEGYSFISSKPINESIFENTDIILNKHIPHEGEKSDSAKEIERLIFLYELNFIIFVSIIFSLVLISFIILLKNLKKIQLQSILGFKFSTSFLENYKETILKNFLIYVGLTFLLLLFGYFKDVYMSLMFVLFSFIVLGITSMIFLLISRILYRSLSRGTAEKFTKNGIIILSLIIVIFNIMITVLSARVYYNSKEYYEEDVSRKNLQNYYVITREQKIELGSHFEISNYMIDKKEVVYREYWKEEESLVVDKNFFEEYQDYIKIDGRPFDFETEYKPFEGGCLFLVTKSNKDFKGKCAINKYIFIDNTDVLINTFDFQNPQIKLNDTAILVRTELFMSNLFYKGDSKEEVRQNIQNAFNHFGINANINIRVAYDNDGIKLAKTRLIEATIALICSLFSITIATSFYGYMLFLKNKNEMTLGIIMGQKARKYMQKSFVELLITSIITLMILIFLKISMFSFILFGILCLIQLLIIYYNTKKLIQKSIVNFVKGEMV